jgi:hypothetical protein
LTILLVPFLFEKELSVDVFPEGSLTAPKRDEDEEERLVALNALFLPPRKTRTDDDSDDIPTPMEMTLSENIIVGLYESVFVATRAF